MLSKIILENFMIVSFAELEGKEGINAYIGQNGSGKSSVFESIAFIFLDRKKGESYKDYIKLGESSARVYLEWLIGPEPCCFDYSISRTSGSVSRSIQFGNKRYSGEKECKEFMEEHFDLKMLKDIVFNLQDTEAITKMAPADRREIMQKVFNVNFESGLIELKKDFDILDEKIKLISISKKVLSEKDYPYTRIDPIVDEEKYEDYIKEKTFIENKLVSISNMPEIKTRLSGQKTIIDQIKRQFSETENKITSSQNIIKKAIDDINNKTNEIVKLNTIITALDIEIADLLRGKEEPVSSEIINSFEKEIADIRGSLSLISKQLLMYQKGLCDSCGQVCEPTHTEELKQKEVDLQKKYSDINIIYSAAKEKNIAIQKIIDTISKKNQERILTEERNTGAEFLLNIHVKNKNKEEENLFGFQTTKESLQVQINNAEELYKQHLVEFEQKSKEQEDIEPLKKKSNNLDSLIKKIESARIVNIERKRMNVILEQQEEADKIKIENFTVQEQEFLNQSGIMKQTKTILETVLPDFIIAQGCVILENFINDFIKSTGYDMKAKLIATSTAKKSKGVSFYYMSHSGDKEITEWLPATMSSGFEEALLTLAFKLAISFLWNSPIILLDEPDKTSTEENSLALFKQIINLEGFKQVFLISHKEDLIDWIKNEGEAHIYKVEEGTFEEAV